MRALGRERTARAPPASRVQCARSPSRVQCTRSAPDAIARASRLAGSLRVRSDVRVLGPLVLVAGAVIVLVTIGASWLALRREEEQAAQPVAEEDQGLPPSLHPVIDLEACIGSGACVDACPESLLRIVGGVTAIHAPGDCVGHGRCQAACPVDAIKLVFGTSQRGVDLPLLRPGYESSVDGLFVAGELGGMGLIRNAMRQGMKAAEAVPAALARPQVPRRNAPELVDVVIVGAGPAGLAAALTCTERGISHALLDQYALGGSVTHFPRRKLVFTEQCKLPIVGKVGKPEMLKEELIAEFERMAREAALVVRTGQRVTAIEGCAGDFRVVCELEGGQRVTHRGRAVILAIGRRGTPRRLEVPGEELEHVAYRLGDPLQYRDRRVVCVGGGDSALEAAVALADVPGCQPLLVYRGESFSRAKSKNQAALRAAVDAGRLRLSLSTEVREVRAASLLLQTRGGPPREVPADDVIVNVGGVLPTALLESAGVAIHTRYGEA